MADLADLFPGFASHWIDAEEGRIFARSGGSGPPVVLLHGFPETHVMWHRLAPALAQQFTLVIPDLRGYGWSVAPEGAPDHRTYSKREMAKDVIAVMEALGHARFALVGHDRGARVGYRLALDNPGRVERLALLDILPTLSMWDGLTAKRALQVYHWTFLAQQKPMPERLISPNAIYWLEHTLASWTGGKSLDAFDPSALAHYRAFFNEPSRIHACCEDYRAGATLDYEADKADREAGRSIDCPVGVFWGSAGIPAAGASPLDDWRATFAPKATGEGIESGHFLAEENPAATMHALMGFLAR